MVFAETTRQCEQNLTSQAWALKLTELKKNYGKSLNTEEMLSLWKSNPQPYWNFSGRLIYWGNGVFRGKDKQRVKNQSGQQESAADQRRDNRQ